MVKESTFANPLDDNDTVDDPFNSERGLSMLSVSVSPSFLDQSDELKRLEDKFMERPKLVATYSPQSEDIGPKRPFKKDHPRYITIIPQKPINIC